MRIRNNKKAPEKLAASKYFISNPENLKGNWKKEFNGRELNLEIGMGKGDFICGMAQKVTKEKWIGIERFPTIQLKALRKIENLELENVSILDFDAANLKEIFNENEVDNIYLNFSDPWPKARHDKRRLTYKTFLEIYEYILKPEGTITFKTDNQKLFEWSLQSMSEYGLILTDLNVDVHNSEFHTSGENVVTEYETKFSNQGFRINRVVAKMRGTK